MTDFVKTTHSLTYRHGAEIPGYPVAISDIKERLASMIPDVRPSDRVEAVARGLGYRTYAAMRASADAANNIVPPAKPDPSKFRAYLVDLGYEIEYEGCSWAFWTSLGDLRPEWKIVLTPDQKVRNGPFKGMGMVTTSIRFNASEMLSA